MNTIKTFAHGVADSIKEYLPKEYEDYQISVEERVKTNNVVYVGICVHAPEEKVSPTIYMERFYDDIKAGNPINEVMESIADVIQNCRSRETISTEVSFLNFEQVKEMITPMLVNTKANRQMLMQMPHMEVEDLSIICKLDIPTLAMDSTAHTKINYTLMDNWGVSKDKLFLQAFENARMKDEAVLTSISEVIREGYFDIPETTNLLHGEEVAQIDSDEMMLVLSNESRSYGATAILYPGVAEKISEFFPQGYYVLPSSLHETLIVPKSARLSARELGAMVREVNDVAVSKEDVLSDRVYEFDKELGRIKQVLESIQKSKGVER